MTKSEIDAWAQKIFYTLFLTFLWYFLVRVDLLATEI